MVDKDQQGLIEAEEDTEQKSEEPHLYHVLLLNDDYTTMDFVVQILEQVFHKNPVEATSIMLKVHKEGVGLCGTYTREIAETKVMLVHSKAAEAGFPLKATMEKA